MSRPTKFNEKIAERLLDFFRRGHTFRDACAGVGISEDTLARWRKSNPDFAEQINAIKNQHWSPETFERYYQVGSKKRKTTLSSSVESNLKAERALEVALNVLERKKTYMGLPVYKNVPEFKRPPYKPFYVESNDSVQYYDYDGIRYSCPSDLWSGDKAMAPYGDEWMVETY